MSERADVRQALVTRADALIDGHTHLGVCLAGYMTEGYPYCQSAGDLHGKLSPLGFDAWVSFPMPTSVLFSAQGYRRNELTPACDASGAPFEFENRRMMVEVYELLAHLADRFICLAAIDPQRDTAGQVRCLAALASEYPVCGLKVAATSIRSDTIGLLGEGRRLLDWAGENDLPVLMHSAVHPEDPWSRVEDLLRIVEARPEVRFCIAHMARFDRGCLDRIGSLDNCWFDTSALGIHCDLAVADHASVAERRRRFDADYGRPSAVLRSLAEAYPHKVIYGSDCPFESYSIRHRHADGRLETYSLMSDVGRETGCLRSLPAETIRRVARDNTLRFLFGRSEPSA
ncbi:MAG: amidohydrolase family protein [Phycisphaerae bacterium]|nr:amidohydrolase family protein [Phycisphaerae bacterium]